MSQEAGQTQDDQNQLQSEYPANAESGYNETQGSTGTTGAGTSSDDTQTDQTDPSWRPSEDPAIEQAGGTTQATEEEPGRSQQDGKSQGTGDSTLGSQGQGSGSNGV